MRIWGWTINKIDLSKWNNFAFGGFSSTIFQNGLLNQIWFAYSCPEFKFENLKGFWKYFKNQSCKSWKDEQLLFWTFFKFISNFESNFGNSG